MTACISSLTRSKLSASVMNWPLRALLIVAATCCFAVLPIQAADTPEPGGELAQARDLVAAKRWPAALQELKRVNARKDADWNNLMGYTLRKQTAPDLAGAESFYNEALRIDPRHLGALEYSGELYLMKGELDKAELRLAALGKACNDCEELRDLKAATARFKAAGNRYVVK